MADRVHQLLRGKLGKQEAEIGQAQDGIERGDRAADVNESRAATRQAGGTNEDWLSDDALEG